MKKSFILTFALLIMAALPLFSGGKSASDKKTIKVFLTKPVWSSTWPEVEASFNESYPDIIIEEEIVGGSTDWRPVLSARVRTKSLPDIFMFEGAADYQQWKEYTEDLSDTEAARRMLPIARQSANLNGQLMGLPLGISGYGYIYNKKLFDQAGITETPMTYTQLADATEKLQAAGIVPFSSGYGTWWVISNHQFNVPFAQQENSREFIASAGAGSFQGNSAFAELKKIIDLVSANSAANPLTEDHNMQVSLFAGGKVAMIQQGNWKERAIYDTNPDLDIGLLPIPLGDDPAVAGRIPVGIPWYLTVAADSEVKDEAKTFLNWLLNEAPGQKALVEKLDMIPAYDHFTAEPEGKISNAILTYSQAGKTMPWTFGLWPTGFVRNAADALQAYVAGKASYAETMSQLEEEWTELKE